MCFCIVSHVSRPMLLLLFNPNPNPKKKERNSSRTKTMLLFLNLTAKLLFHRFVSRLFICINLFRFTRGRLNCHVFKISLPLSKTTYQNDCIGSKSSEKKLQTPQCLEILSFAITLFCERSAKNHSLMAFNKKALSAISSWSIWSNYRFSFLQLCKV